MDIETKIELIKRAPTEEIITEQNLRQLLETKNSPNHYIGYEISGLLHVGSLILPGIKIKDFIQASCNCTVFLGDWHAWINNKLEGDWDKIQKAAKYYEEAFKLVDKKIKIVLGSDLYHNNDDYWKDVIKVSKHSTLARITRCLTIMGRKEDEKLDFAQFIYPPMQAADMKALDIDIVHAGMDQRKVHMLARDIFPKLKWKPPVALHHHLIPGLLKPEREGYDENEKLDLSISSKMSKSKPWTCIFIHDTENQILDKMKKAWCPERQIENNGVLEMVKYIIFREFKSFEVEREKRFGGNIEFNSYDEVEKAFVNGSLHSLDLKIAVGKYMNKIIEPFRKHFEKPANAKLLDVYKGTEITR